MLLNSHCFCLGIDYRATTVPGETATEEALRDELTSVRHELLGNYCVPFEEEKWGLRQLPTGANLGGLRQFRNGANLGEYASLKLAENEGYATV